MQLHSGRTCTQCGLAKGVEHFSWKDGGKRLTSRCHECMRLNYHENPTRARERAIAYHRAHRARISIQQRDRRKSHLPARLVLDAKKRAKERGLPFDLVTGDIVVPERCPILGLLLVVGEGRCNANSPTLDRVRPELGYVRGNVIVISHRANTIKSDATPEELRLVADYAATLAAREAA
jgi:hypothetical protein